MYLRLSIIDSVRETTQLRSKLLTETQIYLGKIKGLNVQNSEPSNAPYNAKLNYCHGRYEGLQWVLTKGTLRLKP